MLRIIFIIIFILLAIPFFNMAKDYVQDNSGKVQVGIDVIKKIVD